MKLTSYSDILHKTVQDTDIVRIKLIQYCGSWNRKAETTETVRIQLDKVLRQLG